MNEIPAAPRVLVLLAAFNGEPWIEAQLASILGQQGVDVRVVVGDDASSDGTAGLIARLGHDDRVTILRRVHPTGSAAQNFFAMMRDVDPGDCDFVAFSDQDDVWHRDKLARAVEALTTRGAAGYSAATTAFWSDHKVRTLRQNPVTTASDFLFEGAGQGCTFVLQRGFHDRIRALLQSQPFLTRSLHYHDWTSYALARAWNLKWHFDPQPTMLYRQHAQNDTGARSSMSAVLRRIRQIRSGWYLNQLIEISTLAAAAAPTDPLIMQWRELLGRKPGIRRRIGLARFCIRGGRRRWSDRIALVGAALLGWM